MIYRDSRSVLEARAEELRQELEAIRVQARLLETFCQREHVARQELEAAERRLLQFEWCGQGVVETSQRRRRAKIAVAAMVALVGAAAVAVHWPSPATLGSALRSMRLETPVQLVQVIVRTSPSTTRLSLDGRLLLGTEFSGMFRPDHAVHEFRAEAPDCYPVTKRVQFDQGIFLDLAPECETPPQPKARAWPARKRSLGVAYIDR
jgi:hypothetical protein